MRITKLRDGIYEVGATDYNIRSFHGYSTERGSSYNAYLIIDDKITLIDTVKAQFAGELIRRISAIIDPAKIDYIVSNHVEPDHSGALPVVVAAAPNAVIYTSDPNGVRGLMAHYGRELKLCPVKTGDSISLGARTLTFVGTPMLHWPDNMVTYCPEEKILFSNDAFGQHFATASKFDDENDYNILMQEAQKYYANILMPYGAQALKALETLSTLDIEIAAPSHGVILRKYLPEMLKKYAYFAGNEKEHRAVIAYDSMWGSTEKMAHAIADGFAARGIPAMIYDLKANHISDIMSEVLSAEYVCVGSPTLNNNMMPNVSAFLTYMLGLSPKNVKGFAFGSYGWGGQSAGLVNETLEKCKFNIISEPIRTQYVPTADKLSEIEKAVAELNM